MFDLNDINTIESDDCTSPEQYYASIQRAINSGMWGLQGSYGRTMMEAIENDYYEAYVPAYISGPPEDCYPAEGGCGDYDILDRRGYRAAWLERDARVEEYIQQAIFDYMEN